MKTLKLKNRGFSFVEVLISLSIVVLVSMAIYSIQKDIITYNRFVEGGLTRENDIRKFLKDFSLAVREASQSSVGGYLIETASDTAFTFYADTDGDGKKNELGIFYRAPPLCVVLPCRPNRRFLTISRTNPSFRQSMT